MSDDLIRRAEEMVSLWDAWQSGAFDDLPSDQPFPVPGIAAYAEAVRDLLAAVKGLRESLDALDTYDRVLVRALMAESDAGKAVMDRHARELAANTARFLADRLEREAAEVSRREKRIEKAAQVVASLPFYTARSVVRALDEASLLKDVDE